MYKTWGLKVPRPLMDLPRREGGTGREEGGKEPGALQRLEVTAIDAQSEGMD